MSNYLAVATITLVLKNLLSEVLKKANARADVTTLPPNSPASSLPNPGANLFLYQVTPNATLRNMDLPTMRSSDKLVQRSRIILDLNYLISFYGDAAKFEPDLMLGLVVRTLHERAILNQKLISQVIKALPAADPLSKSNLADEPELVRITPVGLSLEELSKLWSVFFQTGYSLSVAYQVSPIQIESE